MVRGELHGGNQSPDPPLAEVEVAEQIRISPLIENVDDPAPHSKSPVTPP